LNIEILPLGSIQRPLLQELSRRLADVYAPLVGSCSIGAALEVRSVAYDKLRRQHRSDVLLDHLKLKLTNVVEDKILAIADFDLFVPSLNFVFGQAQCPGNFAIISVRRLDPAFYGEPSNYDVLLVRATKEAVHELGHTFGLPHCPSPSCVMRFSNSIVEVDEKSSNLCHSCRGKLKSLHHKLIP